MFQIDALLLLIVFLLGGGFSATGAWLLWGRKVGTLEAERDRERERFALAIADLRAEQARSGQLEATVEELNAERMLRAELQAALAAAQAQAGEREQAVAAQLAQLAEVRGALAKDFQVLAESALRQNQQQFLNLANETMEKHRLGATADFAKTKAELEGLLTPVKDTLVRYQQGLSDVEKARAEAYGGVVAQIQTMLADQAQLRAETAKLVHALKSAPKARGRWGEQQLKNVLELAGLSSYVDFEMEVHVGTEDGALRPDAVIRLPGGRKLVVDAKTSLTNFLEAAESSDDAVRTAHLASHARALKLHAEQLGRKDYWSQFDGAVDFVVMFVPGEHFVTAALEVDPSLWDFAFSKRVLIATPTNLIAIARTVSHVWRQEKLAEQAQEIGGLGKELYKRLRAMGDHVLGLGKSIDGVVKKYNAFVGSLESSVLPQARRFEDLQLETQEERDSLAVAEEVDLMVRLPSPGRDLELS